MKSGFLGALAVLFGVLAVGGLTRGINFLQAGDPLSGWVGLTFTAALALAARSCWRAARGPQPPKPPASKRGTLFDD